MAAPPLFSFPPLRYFPTLPHSKYKAQLLPKFQFVLLETPYFLLFISFKLEQASYYFFSFFFADVPVCREDREELFGALKHETVSLRCEVDSNPPLVDFHWTFNNSGDLNEVPVHRYVSSGTVSHLNYTPVTDMDYGTLSCWGENVVGRQRVPCMYQVVAAGTLHFLWQKLGERQDTE